MILAEEFARIFDGFSIAVGRKSGIKVGLCGQAPSDYPEYAEFLVRQGIHSIST